MADVVVRRLLDSKAAPDQQNVQGDIPLLWACRAGARGAAEMLLDSWPAGLTLANQQQQLTALMCAAAARHLPTLQLLLGRNPPAAYIDSRDSIGRTALHFCVSSEAEGNEAGKAHEGAAACVSALLGAGADWRVRDAAGRTALTEAMRNKCVAAADVLQAAWSACDDSAALLLDDGGSEALSNAQGRESTRSSRKKRPTKKAPSTSQANGFPRGKDKLAMQTEQIQQTQQQLRQEGGTDALATVNRVESCEVDEEGWRDGDQVPSTAGSADEISLMALSAPVPIQRVDGRSSSSPDDEWTCVQRRRRHGTGNHLANDSAARRELRGAAVKANFSGDLAPALPLDVPATSVVAPGSPPSQPKPPATGWQPWNGDGAAHAFSPTRLLSGITQQASTVAGFANTRRNARSDEGAHHEAVLSARVGNEDTKEGPSSAETAAWLDFASRQPTLIELDVQLRHMLGDDLEQLSMAQISELLDVQRLLVARLEEARLNLARRQEREVAEERMIQVFEARLRSEEAQRSKS